MRRAEHQLVEEILAANTGMEEKLANLAAARKSGAAGARVDEYLLAKILSREQDIQKILREQAQLRETLEQMTKPPLFPATLLGKLSQGMLVMMPGGGKRVVTGAPEFDAAGVAPGDDVLLNPDLNLVVSATEGHSGGEVGTFARMLGGRIVVRHRDEEYVVQALEPLRHMTGELKAGDLIRFDRNLLFGFERLPRPEHEEYLTTAPPKASFADVGGLDAQIEELKSLVELRFFHEETALRYGLTPAGAVLLEGPPGTGKTMLAAALANWVKELSGMAAAWISVKPGELRSEWYGVTERKIREVFEAARRAQERNGKLPVILFFDELDAIGGARGRSGGQLDDRVMQAFAAEMDGVSERGNILLLAATNRREALDPALTRPGRFGDKSIVVGRPKAEAARAILGRHLREETPVYVNGHGGAREAREELIATAVSRLYAPNGQAEVAKLVFRDGKERKVKAADMISGASLANIAQRAREMACRREVRQGAAGVKTQDLLAAIDAEMASLGRLLTPFNARDHVSGLPDDLDVVRVERPDARAAGHRYLRTA